MEKDDLNQLSVYIIHVGMMRNRGTQALISSDVKTLKQITQGKAKIIISTTDEQGVKNQNLPVEQITPPTIDIPFEKADNSLRKAGNRTRGFKYLAFSLFYFLLMFIQAILSIISAILLKIGLKPIYRSNVLNAIKNSDVVISCSDENFKEGSLVLPLNIFWIITWWSLLFSRTWDISIAKFFNKPVIMFPNSVGPFRTPIGRFLARLSLNNCESILVRDPLSYGIIKQLGITSNIFLTSDSALLYGPIIQETEDHKKQSPILGVSPGFYTHILSVEEINNYLLSHAKALDKAIETIGVNVMFLPHYVSGFKDDDLDVSNKIYNMMKHKDRAEVIETYSLTDFKAKINLIDVHISSKMHPAILATSSFIPTIIIVYDHKQVGYYNSLKLENLLIDINDLNDEILYDKIMKTWSNKDLVKKLLKISIPRLQGITLETIDHVIKNICGMNSMWDAH